jgi:conjugal transfer/entry exclusion protein
MRKWCLLLFLGLALIGPRSAHAQGIPVYDNANFIQNVIQAVQLVLTVANQILELTPVGSMTLSGQYSQDLNNLGAIIQSAQGLSYDIASIQGQVAALFNVQTVPTNSRALALRMAQIRQVQYESYLFAMRTQTLLRTTLSTIRHLTQLVGAIADFVGNMQGNQTMSQFEGARTEALARLQVQTAAFERAPSIERIAEPLLIESLTLMNEAQAADWPRP